MGLRLPNYKINLKTFLHLMSWTGYLPLQICPSGYFLFQLKNSAIRRVVMMGLDFVTGICGLLFLPLCYLLILDPSAEIYQLFSLQYYTKIMGGNTTSTLARMSYKAVSVLGVWIYTKTGKRFFNPFRITICFVHI